jgi:hypothetical protein
MLCAKLRKRSMDNLLFYCMFATACLVPYFYRLWGEKQNNIELAKPPITIALSKSAISVDATILIQLGIYCQENGIPYRFKLDKRNLILLSVIQLRSKKMGYEFFELDESGMYKLVIKAEEQ